MSADKLPNIQTLLVDEAGNVLGTNANPLVTSGGGGGGGGTVDQGTPNTADNAWSFRLSNGIGFYDGATEAKQDTTNTNLTNIDNQLSDIQTNQTNKTQSAQITDGTNVATLLNAAPTGTEWGLGVRLIGASVSVSNFPTDDDAGTPGSAVPTKASYIGGTDSNNLLRGIAANADGDANPSSGKIPTLPAVVKNTVPPANSKFYPLKLLLQNLPIPKVEMNRYPPI